VLRVKLLLIHAREFKYRVTAPALSEYEEVSEVNAETKFENALVVFTTIEYGDKEQVVEKAVNELKSVIEQIKPSSVVIYPYAHLSPELAPPHKALELLKLFEDRARSSLDIPVARAPFGWYKEFTLNCYGHPLSELSKTIRVEASAAKREITRKYYILTPSGEIYEPGEFDYSNFPDLKILVDKEVYGKELEGGENRVNDYCRKFGFEWESMSDHGHMRYGPYAAMIVDLIMQYSWQIVRELGIPVFRVMGTNMFNLAEKPVYEHAVLFGDRLYEVVVDNNRYVLRYAACHQQFAMLRDWVISYKQLPFGVFEIADSYRLEQRGELNLCFRLRRFYMPDLHILTRDLREAIEVAEKVQEKILSEIAKLGRRYVALYNVTEDFFKENFNAVLEFVKRENYPALISVLPSGIYYWVLNVEYHIIDNINRPREIATFQIDIGNGARFNITYVDENGEKHHPVIIHTAIIGGIERYIYTVLDTAAQMEKRGEVPCIPTWLSPIQVRVIPVSRDYIEYAERIAEEIARYGFRVDIDDRDETLGKKIRDAGREWVPYIVVVGDREVKSNTINARIRKNREQNTMTVEELVKILEAETKGYPKTALALPSKLSLRPVMSYQV